MAARKKFYDGAVKSIDVASRRIVGLAYPPQLDRDGETIKPTAFTERGLNEFRKKPTLLWAHDYRSVPIGVVTDIQATPNGPEFEARFFSHEQAERVWRIYADCAEADIPVPLGVSVGFMPVTWTDQKVYPGQTGRTYTEVDLFEISVVPVPSNPGALAEARSKGVDVDWIEERAIQPAGNAQLVALAGVFLAILDGTATDVAAYAREALGLNAHFIWANELSELESALAMEINAHLYYILAGDGEPAERATWSLYLLGQIGAAPIEVQTAAAQRLQERARQWAEKQAACPPHIIKAGDHETAIKVCRGEALNRIAQLSSIAKEGRVLSTTNRELLNNCVTQLNEAVRAMQDLLDATDTTRSYSMLTDLSAELVQSISENTDISTRMAALLMRGYETTTRAAVYAEPTDDPPIRR